MTRLRTTGYYQLFVFLVLTMVRPWSAHAAPGKNTVSLAVSYGEGLGAITRNAAFLDVGYEREITDVLSWHMLLGAGIHGIEDVGGSGFAGGGITMYLSDVLRYVVYAMSTVGVQGVFQAFENELSPVLQVGVGIDFLHNRQVSWGIFSRFSACIPDCSQQVGLFVVGLRTRWHWGHF